MLHPQPLVPPPLRDIPAPATAPHHPPRWWRLDESWDSGVWEVLQGDPSDHVSLPVNFREAEDLMAQRELQDHGEPG